MRGAPEQLKIKPKIPLNLARVHAAFYFTQMEKRRTRLKMCPDAKAHALRDSDTIVPIAFHFELPGLTGFFISFGV